ncbi:nose resistant to fluoxetine protein 6-like [Centruroides sculpturatus]|uniref:nose resistant to fluoxetine protein 6-like n=1 Tax=Centruroides sculpturatus TaxID=218467 RepID=UPI000C6E2EDA|nr:nose resistant to fluoxetine protein 6-like [Centruroides sculpturatus]
MHRIFSSYAWTIGNVWLCVACISGYGGIIHQFLSLKIFVVLDRLNLWIYLLHSLCIFYIYSYTRSNIIFTELNLWIIFIFVMSLTLIASTMFYVFLETPLNFLFLKLSKNTLCKIKESPMKEFNTASITERTSL